MLSVYSGIKLEINNRNTSGYLQIFGDYITRSGIAVGQGKL